MLDPAIVGGGLSAWHRGARVPACLLDEDVRFAPALDAITQEAMQ